MNTMKERDDMSVFRDQVSFKLDSPVTGTNGQIGSFKVGQRTQVVPGSRQR